MNDCQQDPTAAGARDAAVIALGYGCGLRRAELINLDLADYDPNTNTLKFTGKRSKQRTAHITGGALGALADWLAIRGNQPGALFLAVNKGGKVRNGRMTTQAIYNLLVKRGAAAGLNHFSPHDMRHTFISDLLDAGADIVTVSKMAGHSNVETTARYDRRPEAAKAKAAGLLHIPYQARKPRPAQLAL
jgi:integrase